MEKKKNCLQLKRKLGQKTYLIVNGEEIEIIINEIGINFVALLFIADKEKVAIMREEIMKEHG